MTGPIPKSRLRARFAIYMAMPVPKIETMRATDAAVADIIAAVGSRQALADNSGACAGNGRPRDARER